MISAVATLGDKAVSVLALSAYELEMLSNDQNMVSTDVMPGVKYLVIVKAENEQEIRALFAKD